MIARSRTDSLWNVTASDMAWVRSYRVRWWTSREQRIWREARNLCLFLRLCLWLYKTSPLRYSLMIHDQRHTGRIHTICIARSR